MKETTRQVRIYRSPFVILSPDWDQLTIGKYGDYPLEIVWEKKLEAAEIIIIPSHIHPKSMEVFNSFLKSIPDQTQLLIYPEVLSKVTDLVDVTAQQLLHRLWIFPSSVLLPEEIIHEINKKLLG